MLLIAQKYQVHSLRDDAVTHLRSEFPFTLEEWDKVVAHPWKNIKLAEEDGETEGYIFIRCANLASEYNLLTLLPSVFLGLCNFDLENILNGYDGPNDVLFTLSPVNLRRFIVGLDALRVAQHRETFRYLEDLPVNGCSSEEECQEFRDNQFREYVEPPATLRPVTEWDDTWDEQLCETCLEFASNAHNAGRRRVWNTLPGLFDLLPWQFIAP